MSTRKLTPGGVPGTVAWVLPNPTWNDLLVRSKALTHTYTLSNTSDSPVTVSVLNLVPGGDSRLKIKGGTCRVGSTLAPRATCTITLCANPQTIGVINQVLCVQHNGMNSPLRIAIDFTVTSPPSRKRSGSYLVDETRTMERQRRLNEQDGHRRLAKVHAREHNEDQQEQQQPAPEGEMQNSILQNPWLDSQRFDGIDPNLNPEPPLNSDARREFDNERREQEMEKQLRLGNMPKFNVAPKPQGF